MTNAFLNLERLGAGPLARLSAGALALAAVASGAAPLAGARATGPAPTSSVALSDASTQGEGSEFGVPVVVNGVRISDLEIKRALVYGPGSNALAARKLQVLMDHEIALRRHTEREGVVADMPAPDVSAMSDDAAAAAKAAWEAGVTAEVDRRMQRYFADPAAIAKRLADEKASFQERYPTLDHEVELQRAYTSGDWYREQVAQTMNFDALFFPDHPDTWPALSIEAIHAGSPEVDLIADYAREYERRKAVSEASGEPIVAEQEMMMALLRDFVMNALWGLAEIKTATQGIPPELAMVVEGGDWRAEIKTQDVFDEMRSYFSEQDVVETKHFLALMEATRQREQKEGILMSEEEFQALVSDINSQMQNSMFSMEFLALQGHGFPSQEAYNAHLRLVESLRRAWEPKLQLDESGQLQPEMAAHMPLANSIMGLARAEVEVLFVSAFDFPNYRWKENGWEDAKQRAYALRTQIDEYLGRLAADQQAKDAAVAAGENYTSPDDLLPFELWWRNLLDLNSDYWDPPLPATGKAPPAIGLKNRGRFQDEAMTRNDMKRAIGESEFTHFLGNDSVVDKVFFDLEPGMVGGPYLGPKGYYILYVESRTAPTNPLRVSNERHLQMLQEDYVRKAFQRYAHESLAMSETSGL
ncbi:MAG: hypothetical protein R3F49_15000 [Planctomycetota bacterium]